MRCGMITETWKGAFTTKVHGFDFFLFSVRYGRWPRISYSSGFENRHDVEKIEGVLFPLLLVMNSNCVLQFRGI